MSGTVSLFYKAIFLHSICLYKQDAINDDNYREQYLRNDQEVNDWLEHTADPVAKQVGKRSVINGGIRLLICERLEYSPPGFRMSRSSFLAVERAFGLPGDTLAVLSSNAGEHSVKFINLSTKGRDSIGEGAFYYAPRRMKLPR